MPIYHSLGNIPPKRHTIFSNPKGGIYYEQLFGTEGFSGHASLLYHVHRPTQIKKILDSYDVTPRIAIAKNIRPMMLKGLQVKPKEDFLESRVPLMLNADCTISVAAPTKSLIGYFYKNADADELIFVHKGEGVLHSLFGDLRFRPGDYLVIPRAVIYQISFETTDNRLLITESYEPIYTPKSYKNASGQLLEHAPFCERDYILPQTLQTFDQKGDFLIKTKKQGMMHQLVYATHPFDVVGWDGYNYPYGFSIHNFEPITGRVHLPPPIHLNFETSAMVICSFCPRLYDYHPQAIPAPYNHSNIDSDEVLYYVDGDFMSRNDIKPGDITLHPKGVVHGPAPGAYERSIGQKETHELAVMIDTFRPLQITEAAMDIDNVDYATSWLE
ncbi:MAG: homogentisate 1,2-dioxygenase [Flavobacteriales bacterium]|nr:homogentisate 1,2-dioxygenase [Flavobacteriales bacterium]